MTLSRFIVRTLLAALWVASVALLLACPGFTNAVPRTPVPDAVRARAVAAVAEAWREAGLPRVSFAGVAVEQADTCDSYASLCWPWRAVGCPRSTGSLECAPDDEHVIIAPRRVMTAELAIHGLVHVASALADLNRGPGDDRGADLHHADHRLWATYGAASVEARAAVLLGEHQ